MTHAELVEHAVSFADGIVVARNLDLQSMRVPVEGHPNYETDERFLIASPIEWLKGGSAVPMIRIGIGPMKMIDLPPEGLGGATKYVLFLSLRKGSWQLNSSPNNYLQGIGQVDDDQIRLLKDEIAAAEARQTLKSLARRADVIAYGAATGRGKDNHPFDRKWRCAEFRVSEGFRGTAKGDTLCIFTWVPGFEPDNESLVFAQRMKDGTLEILSSAAGTMDVVDGKIKRTGEPLKTILGELRDSLAIWGRAGD